VSGRLMSGAVASPAAAVDIPCDANDYFTDEFIEMIGNAKSQALCKFAQANSVMRKSTSGDNIRADKNARRWNKRKKRMLIVGGVTGLAVAGTGIAAIAVSGGFAAPIIAAAAAKFGSVVAAKAVIGAGAGLVGFAVAGTCWRKVRNPNKYILDEIQKKAKKKNNFVEEIIPLNYVFKSVDAMCKSSSFPDSCLVNVISNSNDMSFF
jgi:hypothetical protein